MSEETISAEQLFEKKYVKLCGRLQTQFADPLEAGKCLQKIESRFYDRMLVVAAERGPRVHAHVLAHSSTSDSFVYRLIFQRRHFRAFC